MLLGLIGGGPAASPDPLVPLLLLLPWLSIDGVAGGTPSTEGAPGVELAVVAAALAVVLGVLRGTRGVPPKPTSKPLLLWPLLTGAAAVVEGEGCVAASRFKPCKSEFTPLSVLVPMAKK
jgi:hypothetical protein